MKIYNYLIVSEIRNFSFGLQMKNFEILTDELLIDEPIKYILKI
jgi:hypothetical protein